MINITKIEKLLIDLKKSPAITDLDKLTALGTAGLIMNELKTIIRKLGGKI